VLSNKRAVITGGSSGIGFAIAKAFAKNNANLVLIARNEKRLKESASILSQYGGEITIFPVDLLDHSNFEKIVENIIKIWPEIDVLVNNAGTAKFTPFTKTCEDELDMHFNLNVKVPYLLTQKLFDALAARSGSVINVSSYFSHRMLPGRPSTAYSLTKGAIESFTKSLANESGPKGVRVNAIAPGTVNTPLVRLNIDNLPDEQRNKFAELIKTIYPLGRIGEPDDVSGAAVFLASDYSRWITGAVLAIDGGLTTN